MKRRVRSSVLAAMAWAFAVTVLTPPAVAQVAVPPTALEFEDAEIFRPTTDGGNFITVYDADALPPGRFHLGFYGDYAKERGITEITPAVMDTARAELGLEGM